MELNEQQLEAINSNRRNSSMNWTPPWTTEERYMQVEPFVGEEWKQLTHAKGKKLKDYYYISNLGRILSLSIHNHPRILPGTLDLTTGGYVATMLRTADNHQIGVAYHSLVAYYFIGEPSDKLINPVVDHIDSNKLNNRVHNLQWLSASDNTKKALHEGRCEIFSNNGGWNKRPCYFVEYPEHRFSSLIEAAYFIDRNSDYVAECLRLNRKIKDKSGNELHVITVSSEENK